MANVANEIESMRECWATLARLDSSARARVLRWLTDVSVNMADPAPTAAPWPPPYPLDMPPGSVVKVTL